MLTNQFEQLVDGITAYGLSGAAFTSVITTEVGGCVAIGHLSLTSAQEHIINFVGHERMKVKDYVIIDHSTGQVTQRRPDTKKESVCPIDGPSHLFNAPLQPGRKCVKCGADEVNP